MTFGQRRAKILGYLFAQLVSKIFNYVVMIHQRHRRTDRQTDDMQSQHCALHYRASRGKKLNTIVTLMH